MKIEIKRDHPYTLVGLMAFGFIVAKIQEGITDEKLVDQTTLVVFLLFIVAAYLLQIRQTVILEEGKLTFIEKKQKIELLISDIISVSRKGRVLRIVNRSGNFELDVGWFSKKNLQTLLSHIGNSAG